MGGEEERERTNEPNNKQQQRAPDTPRFGQDEDATMEDCGIPQLDSDIELFAGSDSDKPDDDERNTKQDVNGSKRGQEAESGTDHDQSSED